MTQKPLLERLDWWADQGHDTCEDAASEIRRQSEIILHYEKTMNTFYGEPEDWQKQVVQQSEMIERVRKYCGENSNNHAFAFECLENVLSILNNEKAGA